MQLNVDLLPGSGYTDVVVVIDVLRTCTVAPILFERGLERLELTPSLRAARAAARGGVDRPLLVGERHGLPPEGFNYGNSPAELATTDLAGRAAILVSENAPSALPNVSDARHVALGSLYNASAVTAWAAAHATDRVDLVCCGFRGQVDLDDVFTAGVLAADLAARFADAELMGAVRFAMTLLQTYPEPVEALWQSVAGAYLREIELEQDIGVAARLSLSDLVPFLQERIATVDGERFRFGAHRPA